MSQKVTKRSNSKRHIKSEHLGQRFNCPECPEQFKRKEYLRKHQKKYHQSASGEVDPNLSVPVSIPLTDFQAAVNDLDLGLLGSEDPIPQNNSGIGSDDKEPRTAPCYGGYGDIPPCQMG